MSAKEKPKGLLGTVQEFRDGRGRRYYKARTAPLADGTRLWLKPRFTNQTLAWEYADEKSREAAAGKLTLDKMTQTPLTTPDQASLEASDDWYKRVAKYRET